jgi:HrpA-like RNA helicase
MINSKSGGAKALTNKINELNNSNITLDNKTINKINQKINNLNKTTNTNIPQINSQQINNKKNNNQKRNTHVAKKDLFKPLGFLDPEGMSNNPLTGLPYENLYLEKTGKTRNDLAIDPIKGWSRLPIYSKIKEIIEVSYENQVILVVSGTGSGKTVTMPPILLHILNYQGRIAITNPKKIPSEKNAIFAAMNLDVQLGKQVGVKYRGSSPDLYSKTESKLVYCTDGYILGKFTSDPMLSDYDCLIIDEAHERGIQIDMLLLSAKHLILKRPEFKLIIMSATVNENIFIDYFPKNQFKFGFLNAGEIPNYPIIEHYLDKPINKFDDKGVLMNPDAFVDEMVKTIIKIMQKTPEGGDILGFVTGKGEGDDVCIGLHKTLSEINKNSEKQMYCTILSGASDQETTEYAVKPDLYKTHPQGPYTRKIVIATEIAESSLTIPSLLFVVDSGLANMSRYYSDTDIHALEKRYISKASHKQRRGRTGRTAPGECYNLFTKEEFEKTFLDYSVSPIKIEDISNDILSFLSRTDLVSHIDLPFKLLDKKKNNSITKYPIDLAGFMGELIELPYENSVQVALKKLFALGGIRTDGNKGYITELGKAMAKFTGTKIEISKMIISSYNYRCSDEICQLAALYEVGENRFDGIFERFRAPRGNKSKMEEAKRQYETSRKKWVDNDGDPYSLLKLYREFEKRRYDEVNRRTGEIRQEKKGDAKEWSKANTVNYRRLENVRYTAKDLIRKLYSIARDEREKSQQNSKDFVLFPESYPNLIVSKTTGQYPNGSIKEIMNTDKNIQRAILDGFFINLIKSMGRNFYQTCFTTSSTVAQLSRESLFARIKKPTNYAFYTEYKSIFGKASYEIVGRVPTFYLEEAIKDPIKKIIIEKCKSTKAPERTTSDRNQFKKGNHKNRDGKRKDDKRRDSKRRRR